MVPIPEGVERSEEEPDEDDSAPLGPRLKDTILTAKQWVYKGTELD